MHFLIHLGRLETQTLHLPLFFCSTRSVNFILTYPDRILNFKIIGMISFSCTFVSVAPMRRRILSRSDFVSPPRWSDFHCSSWSVDLDGGDVSVEPHDHDGSRKLPERTSDLAHSHRNYPHLCRTCPIITWECEALFCVSPWCLKVT